MDRQLRRNELFDGVAMNRRKFLQSVSLATILLASPSLAGINNPGSASSISGPTGKALIGGFDVTGHSFAFANLMKMAGSQSSSLAGDPFPSYLDSNGYPNNAPGNTLSNAIQGQFFIPSQWGSQTLVVGWSGTGIFYLNPAAVSNFTVTAGTSVVNSNNLPFFITVSGANVRMTFNFTTAPSASAYIWEFPAGTYNGMSNLYFCRLSDETAVLANNSAFNPDFISTLKTLNPKIIRAMDWSGVNNGNQTRFSQRAPVGAFSFQNTRWPPECWAGTIGGTNTYTCSAPSGWSGLVDGASVQGQFTNANTVTNPTLNVASTGAIPILNLSGGALSNGAISAAGLATLTYDAVLNSWLFKGGGFNFQIPLELHCTLANAVQAHVWFNLPIGYHTLADASSLVAVVQVSLNSALNFYAEYGNEIWNGKFTGTALCEAWGTAFGFSSANNRWLHGPYALFARQMFGAITTAWGGSNSRLKRVLAWQAFDGGIGTGGSLNVYRLQGSDLAPSGTSTGTGNATYNSITGSANYTTSPNRPIDYCDVCSYATYYSGAQCANFDANYANVGGTGLTTGAPASGPGSALLGLLGAADAYAAGGSTNIANAIAWLDWDINQGTNNGAAGGQTLLALNSGANSGQGIYPPWETVVASYDASRPGIGLPILTVENYEGAMESIAPSTSECTTLGISTAYGGPGGKIDNLLTLGYKNSAAFQATVTAQFNQFMAQTHSKTPAWYVIQGPSQWSLFTGDTYSGPVGGGTPFTSWNANVAFN